MKETDKKKLRNAEFTRKHTLTREETEKLIREKLARAREYLEAYKKREELLLGFR